MRVIGLKTGFLGCFEGDGCVQNDDGTTVKDDGSRLKDATTTTKSDRGRHKEPTNTRTQELPKRWLRWWRWWRWCFVVVFDQERTCLRKRLDPGFRLRCKLRRDKL